LGPRAEEQQLQGLTYVEDMAGFALADALALAHRMDTQDQGEVRGRVDTASGRGCDEGAEEAGG
jgi:hypothetical protein